MWQHQRPYEELENHQSPQWPEGLFQGNGTLKASLTQPAAIWVFELRHVVEYILDSANSAFRLSTRHGISASRHLFMFFCRPRLGCHSYKGGWTFVEERLSPKAVFCSPKLADQKFRKKACVLLVRIERTHLVWSVWGIEYGSSLIQPHI